MKKIIDIFLKSVKLIYDPRSIIIGILSLILGGILGFKLSLAALLIILLNGAINDG